MLFAGAGATGSARVLVVLLQSSRDSFGSIVVGFVVATGNYTCYTCLKLPAKSRQSSNKHGNDGEDSSKANNCTERAW